MESLLTGREFFWMPIDNIVTNMLYLLQSCILHTRSNVRFLRDLVLPRCDNAWGLVVAMDAFLRVGDKTAPTKVMMHRRQHQRKPLHCTNTAEITSLQENAPPRHATSICWPSSRANKGLVLLQCLSLHLTTNQARV